MPARGGVGEKSAPWLWFIWVSLAAGLAVDLLPSSGEFNLEGIFWVHSMIFLPAVAGTVKPLEESAGFG